MTLDVPHSKTTMLYRSVRAPAFAPPGSLQSTALAAKHTSTGPNLFPWIPSSVPDPSNSMTLKSVVGDVEPELGQKSFPQPTIGIVVPLKWSPTVWSTWFQFPPAPAPSQAGCTTPPVVTLVVPSADL